MKSLETTVPNFLPIPVKAIIWLGGSFLRKIVCSDLSGRPLFNLCHCLIIKAKQEVDI